MKRKLYRKFSLTKRWLYALLLAWPLLTTSCGLLDMDFDEGTQVAYDMRLNRDTAYVMVGDTLVLTPLFVPDSVSNHEVFFTSEADSIATVENNQVVGVSEGEARIMAISVQDTLKAYCHVFVLAPWTVNPYDYSNDMVVYATATFDGLPYDPSTQQIGAFSGPQFRGMGQLVHWQGRDFLQFRIYGHLHWGDDELTRPEFIRFACYDKEKFTFEFSSTTLDFDGETHGSPSEPMELRF